MSITLTFSGSGLDRSAALRARPDDVAALLSRGDAQVLPLWRGKPLAGQEGALGWLPPDHPALSDPAPQIFLGLGVNGEGLFARDISQWEPDMADAAMLGAFFDPSEQHHPLIDPVLRFVELRGIMVALSAHDAELAATARALFGWHSAHGFCSRCGSASEMAASGWLRRCPACNAEHYPRTDPVVIMLITRRNSVLIGRSAGWPPGMYSLLAGFIEPGETIEAAVRREVAEETGVIVGRVGYIASQPWPFPASLMLGCIGEAESEAITIDPAEIEDARWLTREEMAEVYAGNNPDIRPPRRGAIAHYLVDGWLRGQFGQVG